MPTERREGAIRVGATGQRATGGARRFQRKAAVFGGWQGPDESRGSCPDRGAARGETPRADSANPHVRVCEGWGRQRPHLLGLRQEKSWKGEWKRNLKPFEAIQRVRPPPGRGAARQPEASLAWETATSLVKRRQQMLKPCVSLEIEYPLGPSVWVSRGRCRQDR